MSGSVASKKQYQQPINGSKVSFGCGYGQVWLPGLRPLVLCIIVQ
ncbi:MAG: hypothetical protein ACJA13_002142 [Paraglaciecola sp.]|jgi:hypothetical protein